MKYINGVKVIPYFYQSKSNNSYDTDYIYVSYIFPTFGKYKVNVIFNKTLDDMKYLFTYCSNLISIDFHETFDSSKVLCMSNMISNCDSLFYVNVSLFNVSSVEDMERMFYRCDSLTSLDLSNFETKNLRNMMGIFTESIISLK